MPWSTSRPRSDARGYGYEHRKVRAAWLAQLERDGVGVCCIGGEPIYAQQALLPRNHPKALMLDHTPDRQSYRGLACRAHNGQDGSVRGRARQTSSQLRW